jgi:3-oxoacid CoA-transferase subunit A
VNKIYETAADALASLLFDGMTVTAARSGFCDIPENLIAAIGRIEQRTIRTA